jgi:hypothetical protein
MPPSEISGSTGNIGILPGFGIKTAEIRTIPKGLPTNSRSVTLFGRAQPIYEKAPGHSYIATTQSNFASLGEWIQYPDLRRRSSRVF